MTKTTPASYLILMKDEKLLLLRRFNTGYEDGNYSLIAGHVEEGESFTDCIIREAKEEAGITVKPEDLSVRHVMHRNSHTPSDRNRVDVFFSADTWEGTPVNCEPGKCDDMSWFSVSSLPDKTVDYIRYALSNIESDMYYSEWGWGLR